ncbi:MAG: four-carbon acid sugar kinase family protein [Anaerolineales bacterium]|nr:MAG: four-carbon acid sugar kinase family protein [Anaerolineales bacterium]
MPAVIIIADDLSGAADSGVSFAEQGYQTHVIWDVKDSPPGDVLVLSTESRHMTRDQAASVVQNTAAQLSNPDDSVLIYKKIDSTLRVHPAAELLAVMVGLGISRALVAPAFPAQNRTTVAGIQYVDGCPLDQTSFGEEVSTANVRDLFFDKYVHSVFLPLEVVRQGPVAIRTVLQNSAAQRFIAIADTETMDDLTALVKAARAESIRLFCGSAGLAMALSQTLQRKPLVPYPEDSSRHGVGVLGVIASRSANTVQQIAYAETCGIHSVCPEVSWFLDASASVEPVIEVLKEHLSSRGAALLTAHELPDLPGKSMLICSRLAEVARALMLIAPPAGLVLTGGDMVYQLSTALDAQAIALRGQVHPGVPWGIFMGGLAYGCPVVTKAGGFGERGVLVDALQFLKMK